jgi:hypothetical protein
MLLSFLVTQFVKTVIADMNYRSQLGGDTDLSICAYDAFEVCVAVLNDLSTRSKGGLFSPRQGWQSPLQYAKTTFPEEMTLRAHVSDETGKIPLRKADKRTLVAILEHLGISSTEANSAGNALAQWLKRPPAPIQLTVKEKADDEKTEAPEAKNSDKKQKKPPEPSFSTHLQSYENLASLPSFKKIFFEQNKDRNRWTRFVACTSLYNDGPVNVNSASEDVVDILAKLHPLNADEVKKYLKQPANSEAPPPHYESLAKINELGHGQLKLSAPKEGKKPPAKDDENRAEKDDADKGGEEGSKSSPTRNAVEIDVHCRVLRIDVSVKKGDTYFSLTGLVSLSPNDAVKEKKKSSSKNLTDARAEVENDHAVASSGIKLSLMGIVEHGGLDH